MSRVTIITIIGLLIAKVFYIAWSYRTEGWQVVLLPVLSAYLVWRSISSDREIAGVRGAVESSKGHGQGLRVDLAPSRRGLDSMTMSGVLGALALMAVVSAGLVLYIVVFARLAEPLHLEFEVEWWIAAGGLFLLIALLAITPIMKDRRGSAPVTVYVALIGVVSLGYGLFKHREIRQAHVRCAQAVAAVPTVRERLRIRSATPSCRED